MIKKAVIPAAGLGTRLLPTTKELPKEMIPVFTRARNGSIALKPLLQLIFEKLFNAGVREFCFIVGRGKRAIEDHFTPDYSYLEYLKRRGKEVVVKEMEEFYRKVEGSIIIWVNQPKPLGFGDAVLKASPFVGNEPFIVHAGDTLILPNEESRIKYLGRIFTEEGADAIFLLKEVDDPRAYGVIEPGKIEGDLIEVKRIVEKPKEPPSNLAVIPIYIFDSIIFKILRRTKPGRRGEIELTDAIQKMIDWGLKVYALKPLKDQFWIDIGTPDMYWRALNISYRESKD